MPQLPPCGLYRTTLPIDDRIPAGRLVYFHNHGEPGPGVYLPAGWTLNRARFGERGTTIPSAEWAATLEALPAEGFYRVREPFHCCEKRCRLFEADQLVQLGYDAQARALLFVPEWSDAGLAIPERGSLVDRAQLARLTALKVAEVRTPSAGHPQH